MILIIRRMCIATPLLLALLIIFSSCNILNNGDDKEILDSSLIPANLKAKAYGRLILISWDPVENSDHYDISRDGVHISSSHGGRTWFIDLTIESNTQADYAVSAVFSGEANIWSKPITVTSNEGMYIIINDYDPKYSKQKLGIIQDNNRTFYEINSTGTETFLGPDFGIDIYTNHLLETAVFFIDYNRNGYIDLYERAERSIIPYISYNKELDIVGVDVIFPKVLIGEGARLACAYHDTIINKIVVNFITPMFENTKNCRVLKFLDDGKTLDHVGDYSLEGGTEYFTLYLDTIGFLSNAFNSLLICVDMDEDGFYSEDIECSYCIFYSQVENK